MEGSIHETQFIISNLSSLLEHTATGQFGQTRFGSNSLETVCDHGAMQ